MSVQNNRLKALGVRVEKKEIAPDELARPSDVFQVIRLMRPYDCGTPLIRMGPEADGGYLVPDDLEGIKACFSPGVGNQYGFELDCHERGMEVYMADGSVAPPADLPEGMHFLPKYLMAKIQHTAVHISDFQKGCMTFPMWAELAGVKGEDDLMLQMDVEGFEYDLLLVQSNDFLNRFRIMVVEFHMLHLMEAASFCAEVRQLFSKLLTTHDIVHVHPNNNPQRLFPVRGINIPKIAEITFLRKDRMRAKTPARHFPHPLDRLNIPAKKPVDLPEIFYRDRPGVWKHIFQRQVDALKTQMDKFKPSERILQYKKKQLISKIYRRGHLPAIVMTCDPYEALTRHMIKCYETLWPGHPFEFMVPYQDKRRVENHDRMHFIQTGKGFKETVTRLLEGFSDDRWVFWCIDDKYPIEIDVPKISSLARAVMSDECKDVFCLNLESIFSEMDTENPVSMSGVQMFPCKQYNCYWRHKFIRVGYLRALFDPIPEVVPYPQLMDAILAQTLRPVSHRYKAHDTLVPIGLYGESTIEGRLTRNCHENMQRLGVEIPSGFIIEHGWE